MHPNMTYYNGEWKEIADLFHNAVHHSTRSLYTQEQCEAWAPTTIPYKLWQYRCETKRPFLYKINGRVVGFIEFDPDGHIDCHYVHSAYQRQGIGGILLEHVLSFTEVLTFEKYYVEASHLAKGLYLKYGFKIVEEKQVERRGQKIENFIMEKRFIK